MAPTENKKRKTIGIVLVVLLLTVIGGVIGYLKYRSTHVLTDDAFIDGDIYPVSSRIPGKVLEVPASSNQAVKAGDLLVKLDPTDLLADLTTAESNLEVVRNQVAGQRVAMEVVDAQVRALNAQRELLDKEKNRFGSLLRNDHVSREEYDRVLAQWKAINAQIEAAESQRRQIEVSLGQGDTVSAAAVRLAEAQVARLKLNLEHTEIKAPVDGFVTRKNVNVGQVVAPGQPLMSLVPLQGLWITANYKETDLTRVRPGQKVTFEVDVYPGGEFQGEVESIMAGTGSAFSLLPAENATGNYIKVVQRVPVRIRITDYDTSKYTFRVGMSVIPVILVEGK